MGNDTSRQSVLFPDLADNKVVVARFDQPQASSDGGAILLKGCDQVRRSEAEPRWPCRRVAPALSEFGQGSFVCGQMELIVTASKTLILMKFFCWHETCFPALPAERTATSGSRGTAS